MATAEKTPAEMLAQHVKDFGALVEGDCRYLTEFTRELQDAVGEAAHVGYTAGMANGSACNDMFLDLPDESFAGADAATCWHMQELARTFRENAADLREAAERLERAAIGMWGTFGMFGADSLSRADLVAVVA